MAALPPPFTDHLLEHDALPLDDDAIEVLETLSIVNLETIVQQALDLLPMGAGDRMVALGVARERFKEPITADDLRSDAGFRAILQGERSLSIDDCGPEITLICQRALQAVAGRVEDAPPALAMPYYGCDQLYGRELERALAALIEWKGTDGTPGILGPDEARVILDLLSEPDNAPPRLFIPPAPKIDIAPGRRAARIAHIARSIATAVDAPFKIRVDGRNYKYLAQHFAVEPTDKPKKGLLRAPDGIAYGVKDGRGYWKCNVYGGAVLGLAEVPVPTFRVGRFRHYPRAERFGPALARKRGWVLVRHLDHRDPADPTKPLTGGDQNAEIRDLLVRSLPGDMLFVDHPGEPGEDGGHTRVCVEACEPEDRDRNTAPLWGQASHGGAILRRDGMSDMADGHELQFWLVRYTR